MEDSAKRRERLQAMRSEASAAGADNGGDTAAGRQDSFFALPPPSAALGQPLPNPLMSDPAAESPSDAQRFDFYTDPMSAFSSAKRRRGGGGGAAAVNHGYSSPRSPNPRPYYPIARPNNYRGNMAHPSAHQFPVGQSPDHRSYEMPSDVFQSSQWRPPVQYPNFLPGSRGSPSSNESWKMSGGTSAHAFAPNTPRSSFISPLGRAGNHTHSPGRGNFMHSPGRGRGRQYPGSPSPTWSSGRGRSSSYLPQHSGRQGAQSYYIKAMVKDPWRKLTPVVGNILESRDGVGSRLPQSSTARSADVRGRPSNSRLNLAEYLAQSFEEAADET